MDSTNDAVVAPDEGALFGDVAGLIDGARTRAAAAVNGELVMLYWSVGKRIREDVLGGRRAAYGQDVVKRLALRLTKRYGRGWSWQSLFRMMKFAEVYPTTEIFSTVSRILTWSQFSELLTLADKCQREFYATSAACEHWSVRTLRERIASRLYERTLAAVGSEDALQAQMAALDQAGDGASEAVTSSAILLRDPYVLDFLGLPSEHSEAELEDAILDQMQRFLLELGAGFAFVERQKRMPVDGRDYRLDLLMYHIHLRCYVAIELKNRPLEPADFGQMTFYLRWLAAYENREGDAAPLGIVLCAQRGPEQVRLMGLDDGEVRAASYVVEPVRASLARALEA
ncbi:MAG: PDDEXK nuclease domain-containing protein [Coriobacteriia bacterium]|nr:PDDEXK nuclease domain-containing protein [Coriobacteriia bacterium]